LGSEIILSPAELIDTPTESSKGKLTTAMGGVADQTLGRVERGFGSRPAKSIVFYAGGKLAR